MIILVIYVDLKDIKVVFMGTPEFSLSVLKTLIDNTNVVGVITQPDKIVGHDKRKSFTPIKKLALENHLTVFQPEKIRHDYQNILDLHPDIIITCAYGQIIPEIILNAPKYGCINVHASLLPKLRGGAPLHHALIDGYAKTGITIMYMDKGMDTGDIISQKEIPILDSDTLLTIHDKLSKLGSNLLLEVLPSIINGTNQRIKQDENLVTYGYNIKREEEVLNFNETVRNIFNKVRGMNPFPGSYFILDNIVFKVYWVDYLLTSKYQEYPNGEIVEVTKDKLGIKAKDGIIYLKDIKKEGKKRMLINDYLNGEKTSLLHKVVNREDANV